MENHHALFYAAAQKFKTTKSGFLPSRSKNNFLSFGVGNGLQSIRRRNGKVKNGLPERGNLAVSSAEKAG